MDISFYSGDSRNLVVTVVDPDGKPVGLTGANIKWVLIGKENSILLTKSVGSGINITNPTEGQFTVSLAVNDTTFLKGSYQHMARVTTQAGYSSIVLTGTITVQSSLI